MTRNRQVAECVWFLVLSAVGIVSLGLAFKDSGGWFLAVGVTVYLWTKQMRRVDQTWPHGNPQKKGVGDQAEGRNTP